ncbi:MAG TPA: glycoside hydrolase family 20 [Opitutaceae bacterium]
MTTAFQWDLGRQMERLPWLVSLLPRYAEWGYRELYLHLEDAVEFPSLPGVARRGALSRKEMGALVGAASAVGIGVVPIVNLLGHTQYLIKVPALRDLNELRAADGSALAEGQVCPLHPRIGDVADALMSDMAPFCTAGKIHVGLDESFSLGRNPLSKAEIAEVGLEGHFARHVWRLAETASGHRLRLGMWADMLALLPGAIPQLPRGIIAYDWYYYPFGRRPRNELRNFAEYELAPALRSRGIEYWGCPMNGSFRHEPMPVFGERIANIRSWWDRCRAVGAGGMLVTSWEPNRLSPAMTAVVDAAAASLWSGTGADDAATMLAEGFRRMFGSKDAGALARAALACDERAYAGYARWETNERWDGSFRAGLSRLESERAFFARLSRSPTLPRPFSLSVAYRLYLAERDAFIRGAAGRIASVRRALARGRGREAAKALAALGADAARFRSANRAGLAAARGLWALTRDCREKGPNELVASEDSRRLAALRRWIAAAERDPARAADPSPVLGAWQLSFDVLVTEPALQRVVLLSREPGGPWRTVRARTTIEFRAAAARPRTGIRRPFSAAVDGPGLEYRVAVRGLGRVAVASPELTDGVRVLRARGWRAATRRVIGGRPPPEGFPEIDWGRDNGALELSFAG